MKRGSREGFLFLFLNSVFSILNTEFRIQNTEFVSYIGAIASGKPNQS